MNENTLVPGLLTDSLRIIRSIFKFYPLGLEQVERFEGNVTPDKAGWTELSRLLLHALDHTIYTSERTAIARKLASLGHLALEPILSYVANEGEFARKGSGTYKTVAYSALALMKQPSCQRYYLDALRTTDFGSQVNGALGLKLLGDQKSLQLLVSELKRIGRPSGLTGDSNRDAIIRHNAPLRKGAIENTVEYVISGKYAY